MNRTEIPAFCAKGLFFSGHHSLWIYGDPSMGECFKLQSIKRYHTQIARIRQASLSHVSNSHNVCPQALLNCRTLAYQHLLSFANQGPQKGNTTCHSQANTSDVAHSPWNKLGRKVDKKGFGLRFEARGVQGQDVYEL